MVDKKKKPTKKRQAALGKALQDTISKNSTEIQSASDAFNLQSKNIIKTIDKAIETEDKSIESLIEKLENLNKDNKNYQQNKKKIEFEIKMSEAKIKAFQSLDTSLDVIAKLTDKLLTDLAAGTDTKDLIADQVGHLASVAMQLEALGVKTDFEKDDVLKKFSEILEKKQLDKIEKRLKQLDSYLFDPVKRSGLLSNLVNLTAANYLGPIAVQVVDALKLTERVEDKFEKYVKRAVGLEALVKENQDTYEIIKAKVEESDLKDEEKDKLLKALADKEERFEEQEADRTQDFRSTTISLQKKALDKGEENNLGIMQILGMLTGGKLIGGLAKGLIGALGAKGLFSLLKGRLAAGVGTAGAAGALSKLSKAGTLLKGAARGLGATGAVYGAWEGGQFIGRQISENFGEEINDAVWWALQEAPDEVKEKFLKAKEMAANTILTNATTSYTKFVDLHKQSFNYLDELKDSVVNNFSNDKNNATSYTYNMIAQEITKLRESTARDKTPLIYKNIPRVEQFPLPSMTTPQAQENKDNNSNDNKPMVIPPMPGKITMDEIPMYTADDSLLLLATDNHR